MRSSCAPIAAGCRVPEPKVTNNIRRLRFEQGEMTQAALAKEAGVTRQTIIAIEAAKYAPSLELAFRIAHAFGRPLEEVFAFTGGKDAAAGAPEEEQ